ncbi:MAG: hypothetical protein HGN29_09320 [Asgard group archaeon]|nr:hypothetical protein [Asgard group archaeon]
MSCDDNEQALDVTLGSGRWMGIGPFTVQISRILLYLASFLVRTALGGYGLERSILKKESSLAKYWWGWTLVGVTSIIIFILNSSYFPPIDPGIFLLVCVFVSVALIAIFLRFMKKKQNSK